MFAPRAALGAAPELLICLLGAALRVSLRFNYDPTWSFDSGNHWEYVTWIAEHHALPPVDTLRESFHPPLWYGLAALLVSLGVSRADVSFLSILAGIIHLGLFAWALRRFLPSRPWVRWTALGLAAVLPASVYNDGVNYPEALNAALAAAVMLLTPRLLEQREPQARAPWRLHAVCVGLLLGLEFLTKLSALLVALGLAVGAALAIYERRHAGALAMLTRVRAPLLALAVCALVASPYFVRNLEAHRKPFITSFDTTEKGLVEASEKLPYLERRKPSYLLPYSREIYDFPYWPSASNDQSRFFPVLAASTFVDYWSYSFGGREVDPLQPREANGRPISRRLLLASRAAMLGGSVIVIASALGWLASLVYVLGRSCWGFAAVLAIPLLTTVSALHFATKYPLDYMGVVKGAYLQFGMLPACLAFGVAVDWARGRRATWPLLGLLLSAAFSILAYSMWCRFKIWLLPFG